MSLETEYKGHTIRYSENGDEWTCYDIASGKAAAASTLSKMKAKIDKYLLSVRKENSIQCYKIDSYAGLEVLDATLVEYIGPKIEGGGWDSTPRRVTRQRVAAMATRRMNDRPSRQESSLDDFAPLGQATDDAIKEAERLLEIAKEASLTYKAAVKAIPRMSMEDIADLVKISGIDPKGGL